PHGFRPRGRCPAPDAGREEADVRRRTPPRGRGHPRGRLPPLKLLSPLDPLDHRHSAAQRRHHGIRTACRPGGRLMFAAGETVRVKDTWPEATGPVHIRTPYYV